MMRSWLSGVGTGAILGAAVVGISALAWPESNLLDPRERTYGQLDLFADILYRAQTDYVVEIDEGEAIEAAINGMLNSLDPHSNYLAPEDFQAIQVTTSGEYGGLGIEIDGFEGFVRIVAPIDDTPASRAGLESGDLITGVNGKSILGQSLDDSIKQMRGEVGTDISLTILREGEDPFEVTLTREVIRPKSVVARVEDGNIGYIRVSTFNERTTILLEEGLTQLSRDIPGQPAGLILDLRRNGGGLLDQAISVADTFLSGGEVVSTIGRHPNDIERYNANNGEVFKGVPMIVLIDGGSASASEIVAGALQDRGRARVLGVTSFGKGSVQSVIPLGAERGALRLTTARYYTPSGRSIQGTGIEPDIEVGQRHLTEEDLERQRLVIIRSEADLPNSLDNEDGTARREVHIPDDNPPEDYEGDDYQLDRAIDYLRAAGPVADTPDRAG